jgi:uncharacterized membrane-anchored protein
MGFWHARITAKKMTGGSTSCGIMVAMPDGTVPLYSPARFPRRRANALLRKVPEITLIFWITKLLTTAMGESTSDYLVFKINPYLAVGLGAVGLAIALWLQFSARRYVAWIYWLAVLMVAIFGTMAADAIHIQLGVPYTLSSVLFAVVLVVIFAIWYKSEQTLSIHSITTRRRELFYWAAVMATFALGTAAGDLAASTLGLGYFSAGLLFAGCMLVPLAGYWILGFGEVFSFWLAYILTRPLGASFADWFGKSSGGGLGLGDNSVSSVLAACIVIAVLYMTLNRREAQHENPASSR